MGAFDQYYDLNPVGVIDQDQWDDRIPEINLKFRNQAVWTPLIEWTNRSQQTGAQTTWEFDMMEGDVNTDDIPLTANYIESMGVDSRMRKFTAFRYGDKVQLHRHTCALAA